MTDANGRGPIGRLRALIHKRQMQPSETPANDTERDATPEERYRRRCRMIERLPLGGDHPHHTPMVAVYDETPSSLVRHTGMHGQVSAWHLQERGECFRGFA